MRLSHSFCSWLWRRFYSSGFPEGVGSAHGKEMVHEAEYALHRAAPTPPVVAFARKSVRVSRKETPVVATKRSFVPAAETEATRLLRPQPPAAGPRRSPSPFAAAACERPPLHVPTADEAAREIGGPAQALAPAGVKYTRPVSLSSSSQAPPSAATTGGGPPTRTQHGGSANALSGHVGRLLTQSRNSRVPESTQPGTGDAADLRSRVFAHHLEAEQRAAALAKPRFRATGLGSRKGFGPPPGDMRPGFEEALAADELFFARRAQKLDQAQELQGKLRRAQTARRRTQQLSCVSFERMVVLGVPRAIEQLRSLVARQVGTAKAHETTSQLLRFLRQKHGAPCGPHAPTPRQRNMRQLVDFDPLGKRPTHQQLISKGTEGVLHELQRLPCAPKPALSCHDAMCDDLHATAWVEAQLDQFNVTIGGSDAD